MREALYYQHQDEASARVECLLCPHKCNILPDKTGICRSRINIDGKLYSKSYGVISSLGIDPIEKKPLYHFYPGQDILSLGSFGCNLKCTFCQNWQISQQEVEGQQGSPKNVVETALSKKSFGIAYTYNEPLINYEFVKETAVLAHAVGVKNVLVTNGFINPEPLQELLPYIDGVNLDIKAGNKNFYRDVCGGYLEPVLESAQAFAAATHLEITTLLIPGYNNDLEELEWLSSWIAENCGSETPAHLSAYFPQYKLQAAATTAEDMLQALEVFRKKLKFVYAGNINVGSGSTFCQHCGAELVRRQGYATEITGMDSDGLCRSCSQSNNFEL